MTLITLSPPDTLKDLDCPVGVELEYIDLNLSYSGTDLFVFGYLPESADRVTLILESEHPEKFDVVRKEQVGPLWLARKKFRVNDMPSIFHVASSGEADDASYISDALASGAMGFEQLSGESAADDWAVLFSGVVMLKTDQGMYRTGLIRLRDNGLFSCTFELPDAIKPDRYRIRAQAFSAGIVVGQGETSVTIRKAGMVSWLSHLATDHALLYGVMSVLLAFLTGLGVNAVFGRGGGH